MLCRTHVADETQLKQLRISCVTAGVLRQSAGCLNEYSWNVLEAAKHYEAIW